VTLILTRTNETLTPEEYAAILATEGTLAKSADVAAVIAALAWPADAFGRIRVSEPFTLFDSKQLSDDGPLYWDTAEVSGSGTSNSHSTARASSALSVGAATAGKIVRQTKQRFNYQPGKSMLLLQTGVMVASGGGAGIVVEIGYGDENNGVFWKYDEGDLKVVIRSKVSGSVVDTEVLQADFNKDTLDGNGASGITLDVTKAQIFWCDLEWLGVGSVRFGVVINGQFIVAHQANHANVINSVYMSTPNLPIRHSIENTGAGAASSTEAICSTVISEGGLHANGILASASTSGTHLAASSADTLYAAIGIRLKSTHLSSFINLDKITLMNKAAQDFEWSLWWNPTVADTFTYNGITNSACEVALGGTANTVTGGFRMLSGFVKSGAQSGSITLDITNALRLGAAIDGTSDEIVLCVKPFSNSAQIEAALNWRELQ
jgi:hypothetical protein